MFQIIKSFKQSNLLLVKRNIYEINTRNWNTVTIPFVLEQKKGLFFFFF